MMRKDMIALIVVLLTLALSAGAEPAPQPVQVQQPQSFGFGMGEPGGYLGVYLSDVDAEAVKELNLPKERGARIGQVVEDSPAEKAGFLMDDVVVSWNGARVESSRQFKRMVAETPPGRRVNLQVIREGAETTLEPEIGSRAGISQGWNPSPYGMDPHRPFQGSPFNRTLPYDPDGNEDHAHRAAPRPKLGVALQPLSGQLAGFFGLDDRPGVLISSVMKDSAAEAAGLQAGDILLEIDEGQVGSPAEVQQIIARKDGLVDLKIFRDGAEQSIGADLSSTDADEENDEDPKYPRNAM